jgi:hypothetical protein
LELESRLGQRHQPAMAYGHHEVDLGCRLDRARRSTRFRFLAGPVAVAARRGWPLDTSRSARSGRWPGCPPSIPRKARLRAAGTDSPGVKGRASIVVGSELHAAVAAVQNKGGTRTRLRPRSKCPSVQVPIAATSDRFLKCPGSGSKRPPIVPTWTLGGRLKTDQGHLQIAFVAYAMQVWTLGHFTGGCVDL